MFLDIPEAMERLLLPILGVLQEARGRELNLQLIIHNLKRENIMKITIKLLTPVVFILFYAVSVQQVLSSDIDHLEMCIKTTEERVHEQMNQGRKSAIRVLILGTTGSGKSTLAHGLAGRPLEGSSVKKGRRVITIADDAELPGFTIGHGLASETSIPNVWHDKETNLIYCDCPGFMDSRGPEQEIVNAFAIDQLFTTGGRIKILLTIEESEFESVRGNGVIFRLNKLLGLVPRIEQLKQALVLVVTKGSGEFSSQDKVEGFVADAYEEQTQRRYAGKPTNDLDDPIDLLAHLIANQQIFAFPEPKVDGEYILFTDRVGIINNLSNNFVTNIQHMFCLDESVLYNVLQRLNRLGNIQSNVSEFVAAVHADYRSNIYKPQWLKFVATMLARGTSLDFIADLEKFLPAHVRRDGPFIPLLRKLGSSQRYLNFAGRIARGNMKDLSIPQVSQEMMSPLQDMQVELQILIDQAESLRKQEACAKDLRQRLEAAEMQGQSTKTLVEERLRIAQNKAREDRTNLERQLQSVREQQNRELSSMNQRYEEEKARQDREMETLRRQMPSLESQVASLRSDLAKAIARAEKAEASMEGSSRPFSLADLPAFSSRGR